MRWAARRQSMLRPNHSGPTLKVEFYDTYLCTTEVAAKLAVGDWIEHNPKRMQMSVGFGMVPGKVRSRGG
jgi:hypothetical protein